MKINILKVTGIVVVIAVAIVIIFFALRPSVQKSHTINRQASGFHESAPQSADFYNAIYNKTTKINTDQPVSGFFVNHHLLAANFMGEMFAGFATDKPITIVVISPNHFTAGHGLAITSQYDWHTPFGDLQNDQDLVSKLTQSGLVNVDESPFMNEHGIFNLTPFIKKSFPNARFVPIIVKEQMSDQSADQLADFLNKSLPKGAIVIGSLDFSHYQPSNAADFDDLRTLATIYNQNLDVIKNLDVDSHPGLRILLKYFGLRGTPKFNLIVHSNSSKLTRDFSFAQTTSYIDGYFTAGANDLDSTQTKLYVQGVGPQDRWDPSASIRLYEYNEKIDELPQEVKNLKLSNKPVAVGLVYTPSLTKIYEFPLQIINHQISLLTEPEPGKLITEIKQ